MLQRIGDDIQNKHYVKEAGRIARVDRKLLSMIQLALGQTNKKASVAVRSVIENRGTLIIRASSRSGASELYTVRDLILKAAREAGINSVRFTV